MIQKPKPYFMLFFFKTETHFLDQAGLKLRDWPCFSRRMLGLKVCTTIPSICLISAGCAIAIVGHCLLIHELYWDVSPGASVFMRETWCFSLSKQKEVLKPRGIMSVASMEKCEQKGVPISSSLPLGSTHTHFCMWHLRCPLPIVSFVNSLHLL